LCEFHIVTRFHFPGEQFLRAMVVDVFTVEMPQPQLIT
jgi:hypothetical protein